tara:strand:+ start:360 stop:521 length:162 start_codon:yes stop_codon:yes gene_type:complete
MVRGGDLWYVCYSDECDTKRWFSDNYSEMIKKEFWDSEKYLKDWDGEIPKKGQ